MNFELKDFSKDVIEASFSLPVLVDFWAEWCGPCKILGPVLERLAKNNNREWSLVKINSDEHQEIASQYGIRNIPNVKLFYKGNVINEFVGALPENAVKEWLRKNIPNKFQDMLSHAESLLSSGSINQAEKILSEILKQEPNNTKAKILLTKAVLYDDPKKTIQLIDDIEDTSENEEVINSLKTIATLISVNSTDALENSPTKSLYLQAVEKLKAKKFEDSLNDFIEIIRTDRYFGDDVARKACIAIFKYLGEENEITLKYRREFGRALYV